MLHVLLFILKILGIILLAILGLILAGVLLALFVPVRYRADGSFYKISRGEACISWLFRTFRDHGLLGGEAGGDGEGLMAPAVPGDPLGKGAGDGGYGK